jgi:hypothetical protein
VERLVLFIYLVPRVRRLFGKASESGCGEVCECPEVCLAWLGCAAGECVCGEVFECPPRGHGRVADRGGDGVGVGGCLGGEVLERGESERRDAVQGCLLDDWPGELAGKANGVKTGE